MKVYKWLLCIVLVFGISGCIFVFGNYKSMDSAVTIDATASSNASEQQTSAVAVFSADDFNDRLLRIVDAYREKSGLSSWALDDGLMQAAQTRAQECAAMESKSHNRPDGSGWYTVLGIQDESENYNYCEISGIGDTSPETLLRAWVASDSINQTVLLSEEYSICGIGCEAVGSDVYCVLILYKP